MPWTKTPQDRKQDAQRYGTAWRKARKAALDRARHRCEQCGSGRRLQVDHVNGAASDPAHQHLQVLCEPCHDKKSAAEGGRAGRSGPRDPAPAPRTKW